ncbi:MAG: hypothetical protein GY870_13030, partial [archaeon]|nr:hypothetical protein [archaeon]
MVSISSKKLIQERTHKYWKENKIWKRTSEIESDIDKIKLFLEKEYEIIPEKERIGKGSVYITTAVAATSIDYLLEQQNIDAFPLILKIFEQGESTNNNHLRNYAITLMGEICGISKKNLIKALAQVKVWGDHPLWEIREMSGYIIRKGLKKFPDTILYTLKTWIISENDNLRRISIESLRPLSDIKWLRKQKKN